ncbi:hypothetical protein SDJN02_00487, partial [Cucurbita argyrosperma subsp. argyrosperma]
MSYDESEAHFVTVEVVFDVSADSSTYFQRRSSWTRLFYTLNPLLKLAKIVLFESVATRKDGKQPLVHFPQDDM